MQKDTIETYEKIYTTVILREQEVDNEIYFVESIRLRRIKVVVYQILRFAQNDDRVLEGFFRGLTTDNFSHNSVLRPLCKIVSLRHRRGIIYYAPTQNFVFSKGPSN